MRTAPIVRKIPCNGNRGPRGTPTSVSGSTSGLSAARAYGRIFRAMAALTTAAVFSLIKTRAARLRGGAKKGCGRQPRRHRDAAEQQKLEPAIRQGRGRRRGGNGHA